MFRYALTTTLILTLAACGTPRGPAPVEYHDDAPQSPPAALLNNDVVPYAAPTQPVESEALEPLEPVVNPSYSASYDPSYDPSYAQTGAQAGRDYARNVSRPSVDFPDPPVGKVANVAFDAQKAAARNTASGAGQGVKSAVNTARKGTQYGRKLADAHDKVSSDNPAKAKRAINAGQQFGAQTQVISAKSRPASIKVGKGDTLFALSEKYQIALKPLIAENNLKAPYALKVGQTLKLPAPLHYRVRPGDTVMAIARRFSLDFRSLALINGINPPYVLKANDLLVLPSLVRGKDGGWKSASIGRNKTPNSKKTPTMGNGPQTSVRAPTKTSTFVWPLNGRVVSTFGAKPGGTRNDGINISAPAGTAVRAAGSGTVVYAGAELKSFGNLILIRHPNGWVSAYAHNRKLLVKEGATVKTGDTIAEVGATGSVSTPQLHFETRRGRDPVNPMTHLPRKS
ncbi:MAG: hypothetical protein COA84_03040 [Robiginitomaculum sp.]|nr:MAG: hypothetical protein COA84_03040 [Robiginitomaculum sp.]